MRFRKRYKHFKRYRQVANILARHGFRFLIEQLGITEILSYRQRLQNEEITKKLKRGTRLRHALIEMGPTFIKLGQILSTRADIIPKDIISELEKLQDDVDPVSYEDLKYWVETELEGKIEENFEYFSEEPLAAASIGQVHRAKLKDGQEVVVKVRRPEIVEIVNVDLEIIFDFARLAEKHTSWGSKYNLLEVVEEYSYYLKRELDYTIEGRNADRFYKNFEDNTDVKIPKIYWDYTTNKVLTMEFIDGTKLSKFEEICIQDCNLKKIAHNLTNAMLKQILVDGYFHSDPHPGNLAVLGKYKIAFMDFGQIGILGKDKQKQFVKLLLGMVRGNSKTVVNTIIDMGIVQKNVDIKKMRNDVEKMRDYYYSMPFKQINIGQVFTEVLNLAFKYNIQIPTELTMLSKSLLTLEGVVTDLDPDFSIMEVAEPFAKKMLIEQYKPENLAKTIGTNTYDYIENLLNIPEHFDEVLEKLLMDDININLNHQNTGNLSKMLIKITNKISFSIAILSFSIVMAGLVIAAALSSDVSGGFILRMPILEVAFLGAFIMFVWLIFSIFRSGRM